MAILRVQKSTSKKRSRCQFRRLESIPKDLLTEILARVASHSIIDLFNAKATCKTLNQAGSEDYVYAHVTFKNFSDWWRNNHSKKSAFMDKCIKCGNPEALFRKGLVLFFGTREVRSMALGLTYLRKAAKKRYAEATYVYGIVLVCIGGEDRQEGLKLLAGLDGSRLPRNSVIGECRNGVRLLLQEMWINNHIIVLGTNDHPEFFNGARRSCSCVIRRKGGWTLEGEVEEEYDRCCASCMWVHEAKLFCEMLRTGRFRLY